MFNRLVVVCLAVGLLAGSAQAEQLADVIGVAHIQGGYNVPFSYGGPSVRDQLNEGADAILALGSRVIKIQHFPANQVFYPFIYPANPNYLNSYDATQRITQQAKSPQMQTLLGKNFTTYILNIGSNVPVMNGAVEDLGQFSLMPSVVDGLTTAERATEKAAIKNLAKHLLQTYAGTGKTFILANGEADLLMRWGLAYGVETSDARIDAMVEWIKARQEGVTEARAEVGATGVSVVYSCEVQYVQAAISQGMTPAGTFKTAADLVVPRTNCDLYDYTVWDIGTSQDPLKVVAALNYLEAKAPASALYGERNIYIGEYGFGEYDAAGGDVLLQENKVRRVTDAALGWGVRYLVYWQITDYRPEPLSTLPTYVADSNYDTGKHWDLFAGMWLIRPDGSKPRVYTYLQTMLTRSVIYTALRAYGGGHVSATDEGGSTLYVNAPHVKAWEFITLLDLNGGSLLSGDNVSILSHNGYWFMAWDNGGREVVATATSVSTWEKFTVFKQGGTGAIVNGNQIAVRAGNGLYFVAANGGAPKTVYTDPLNATSATIGSWETFTLVAR